MLTNQLRTFWMCMALLTWSSTSVFAAPAPRTAPQTRKAAPNKSSKNVVSSTKATAKTTGTASKVTTGKKATQGNKLPASVVFTVNGEPFPFRTYQVTMLSVRYRLRMNWRVIKRMRIDRLVLDQLIGRMLMAQEARRLGFKASKKDVLKRMRASRNFQRRGKFNPSIYKRILQYMGVTEKVYIRIMQNRMLAAQLREDLLKKVPLGEKEAWKAFEKQFTQLRLRVASLDVEGLAKALEKNLSQAEVNAYVKKNLSRLRLLYMLTRSRRYQRKEQIRARHILLRLSPKAGPKKVAAVSAKMNQLLKLLKRAPTFFPTFAKRFSQGPSGRKGGDLGFFSRGQMVKAFEKAAFSLKKPNDISKIIRTRFGLHIIQLVARRPALNRPFDSKVQKELARELLVRARTSSLANNSITEWQKKLKSGQWNWTQFKAFIQAKAPTSKPASRPTTQPTSRPTSQPAVKLTSLVKSFVKFRLSPFFRRGKASAAGLRQSARGKKQDVFALTAKKPYLAKPILTAKRMEIWRLDARKLPTKVTYAQVKQRWATALKRKKLRKVEKAYVKKLRKKAKIQITTLPLIRRF